MSKLKYKGLGEMNPEQLRKTVFSVNGENRSNPALNDHMARVVASDVHAANQAFDLWMASGARKRRRRLMDHWTNGAVLDNGK